MARLSKPLLPWLFDRYVVKHKAWRRQLYAGLKSSYHRKALNERAAPAGLPPRSSRSFTIARNKGHQFFPTGHFGETQEIVRRANNIVQGQNLDAQAAGRFKKKQLWTGLLPSEEVSLQSPFFQFALRDDVIEAVGAYLQGVPVLSYVDVWYSPARDDDALQSSQLYHCDWDGLAQIKVFILATDVSLEEGPLTVIDADLSGDMRKRLRYRFGGGKNRIADETIWALGGEGREQMLLGPPETTGFVDTSRCFHYGSRTRKRAIPRVVALLQYVAPTAFCLPFHFRNGAPYRHLATPDMPAWRRFVLGAA